MRWLKDSVGHRFVLDIPPEVPQVTCDARRIEQVMNHLLSNAVKYSQQGGLIKIQLEANEVEARISVSDEGVGIPAEYLDRIFDRFYRIGDKDVQHGSGLGLSAARSTIEAHGG